MKLCWILILACIGKLATAQQHGLDFYLSAARQHSPLLHDYQNQIKSNQVDSSILLAIYRTQVNGISNNSYAPSANGFGYDYAVTNGGQFQAIVQASKVFVSRKNLANQINAIHLQSESTVATSSIAEKDLNKTITAQYIAAYGDLLNLNFTKDVISLLNRQQVILKELTEHNIYKQADFLTFYVSLQQQELAYRQLDILFKNDYAMLNYLCGIVDTATVNLPDPDLKLKSLPEIYNTPFYRQFVVDSLKLINQRDMIAFSYKPKVNAFADAGFMSSFTYQGYKNFGASIGLNLLLPIYDGKQRVLKSRKLDIDENTRLNYRDFFLKQYDQQIAQLLQQLKSTESLIDEINSEIKYSNTLIDVNEKLLEKGEVRITDFIIAINTYLNARHLLHLNYINRLQIINQINYWQSI
jgi:outer membrane protein TolC